MGKRIRVVYWVLIGTWVAEFFLIFDRVNISLAIPQIMDELNLSGVQAGMILSVFYWGYVLGQYGGGVVADHVNLRRWTSGLLMVWCALTALTGVCRTPLQFYFVRSAFGLTEGAAPPAFLKLRNHWLLPHERGRFVGLSMGFLYLAAAVGLPLVGWFIRSWGWRFMFFLSGAMTIFAVAVFYLLVRDHPREHPWISKEEEERISEALERDRVNFNLENGGLRTLSFREALGLVVRDWPFWAILAGFFLSVSLYFANMSWLPGYLVKERGYTILHSGLYLAVPNLAAFLGAFIGGYLGDRLRSQSLVGALACLIVCPAMLGVMWAQSIFWVVIFMSLSLFATSVSLSTLIVLAYEFFPTESFAACWGLIGGTGGISGLIAPLVIGFVYDLTGSFFWGFTTFAIGGLLAGGLFIPLALHEKKIKAQKAQALSMNPSGLGVSSSVVAQ